MLIAAAADERRRQQQQLLLLLPLLWLALSSSSLLPGAGAVSTQESPATTDFSPVVTGSESSIPLNATAASTAPPTCTRRGDRCRPGLMLPMWLPTDDISVGDTVARAIVYFLGLCYLFLGISIISDRFMAAIEVITSKEKEVVVKKTATNEEFVVNVRIWNETVSNLTLMALGSSAPEILLSIIEVIGNDFKAGDLGPGTIVGSAAFNLFVIIGVCVYVVPDGVTKRIKHLRVFFITAAWSIFAYVWMYMILALTSPGEVEVWEGILTFMFFPLTVLTAWIADRKILPHMFLTKRYRASKHKRVILQIEGRADHQMETHRLKDSNGEVAFAGDDVQDKVQEEVNLFESHRQEYIEILRELRKKHPNIDMAQLEEMAQYEVINRGPKSRAFYRIQATRKLTGGGGNLVKQRIEREHRKQTGDELSSYEVNSSGVKDRAITHVFFEPAHYTVMENVGSFRVTVRREGGELRNTLLVDYRSQDGTATAGSDYVAVQGTITFRPEEATASFEVTIIDDDVFEEDEHFSLILSNVRCKGETHVGECAAELGTPAVATVMILDDDHAGIFHFESEELEVSESTGEMHVPVVRGSGARGTVAIPYKTIDGTARGGRDFVTSRGQIEFGNNEHGKTINIHIINAEEYQKDAVFYLELGEPKLILTARDINSEPGEKVPEHEPVEDRSTMCEEDKIAELGKPRLGDKYRTRIRIKESSEFKTTVDKLLQKSNTSALVGTSSWKEQFLDAVTVSAGDEDDGEDEEGKAGEVKVPSVGDYVSHYLSLFWKVLFAFVPPTDYFGGWACFVVSIIMIGILTAVVGDLANHFGCTIGLKDAVTAISFVALGTSLPDTFASKVAAMHDEYADSSIGNVTGSNAVNVFLGIGIAWSIAAIKHAVSGTKFVVQAGSLAFAVTLFCAFAFVSIAVLLVRRRPFIGGELGGPRKYKIMTSIFMVLLWSTYIFVSALEYYCYIKGF